MQGARHIQKVVKSRATIEGAGVHLQRAIGGSQPELYDPFLLLDDFRSDEPEHYRMGFPWHPHRGIETITYVLRGQVEHGDSLGNTGVISPGDVQWMTAGSGIIHQEMPKGDSRGALSGFQLWANLPARDKMMEPRYREVTSVEIPVIEDRGGATIRIVAGTVQGTRGPVRDVVIAPEYLDITIPPGRSYTHPTPRGHTVFAYVFDGGGVFCDQSAPHGHDEEKSSDRDRELGQQITDGNLVLFGDGDSVSIATEADAVRLLLISGRPIGEPIAWHGPIVMNTQEELRVAYDELDRRTFIKHRRTANEPTGR
jgi:hypothetical protein